MELKMVHTKKQEVITSILCCVIAFSILVWPLLGLISTILWAAVWLFFIQKDFSNRNINFAIIITSAIYILAVAGFFYSENRNEAHFKLLQKSPLLIFPLIIGSSRFINTKILYRTLFAFTISALLLCLYFFNIQIFNLINGKPATFIGYEFIKFPQTSPSSFTTLALFAFTYLLYCLFKNPSEDVFKNRFFRITGSMLLFATLLLAGNRLSILLASFFLIVLVLQTAKRKIAISFLLITVFGALFFSSSHLRERFGKLFTLSKSSIIQLDEDQSLGKSWDGSSLRLAIWTCGLDLAGQHLLTGVGTGDVQDELQKTYEKRKFYFASRYNTYNAHNQYLQQLLANGATSIILFLMAIGISFYIAITEKNLLFVYFLIIFTVITITESILEHNKGVMWYALFNSLFIFTIYNQKQYGTKSATKA